MRHRSLLILLTLLANAAHADEIYRWRDSDGTIYYSDTAPPPQGRDAERKRLGDRPPDPALPYALQIAQRNFPVTLFVADGCGSGCSQASAYLSGRGVPYAERNASEEEARDALSTMTGGRLEVPLLIVGKTPLRGFQEVAWGAALDAAGYPKSSVLPGGITARQEAKPSKQPARSAAVEGSTGAPASSNPGDSNPN
jgi:hypothetical protein